MSSTWLAKQCCAEISVRFLSFRLVLIDSLAPFPLLLLLSFCLRARGWCLRDCFGVKHTFRSTVTIVSGILGLDRLEINLRQSLRTTSYTSITVTMLHL